MIDYLDFVWHNCESKCLCDECEEYQRLNTLEGDNKIGVSSAPMMDDDEYMWHNCAGTCTCKECVEYRRVNEQKRQIQTRPEVSRENDRGSEGEI